MTLHRVAHVIFSNAIGGSEMCALEICNHLDKRRYAPVVIAVHNNAGPVPQLVKARSLEHINLGRTRLTNLFWPVLPAFRLRSLRIDLLHVHHLAFLRAVWPAARLAGIRRVMCTEHSHQEHASIPVLMKAAQTLPRKISAFTAVSEDIKDFFVQRANIPEQVITVIRNGVDTERFRPGDRSKTMINLLGPHSGKRVIIAVGRLTDAKDYPNLLNALTLLARKRDDFFCCIVGGGELDQTLRTQIRESGLSNHVMITGTRTDIHELLHGADAYVLSSKHEGLPISLMEAMSTGLPVVATRVGGVPEILTHGSDGLLVAPGESEALSNTLDSMLSDRVQARRMGLAARQSIVSRYSWKTIVEAYESLYQRVLADAHEMPGLSREVTYG